MTLSYPPVQCHESETEAERLSDIPFKIKTNEFRVNHS